MNRKKLTGIVLAAVLMISGAAPAWADTQDEIIAAQAEKNAAESELYETEERISSLKSEKEGLEEYLKELNGQLTELSASLEDLTGQIEDKQTEIEVTKGAVERARLEEDKQYENMKARIRYMYESGSKGLMVTLLESSDIAEMLNKASEAEELADYDREQLNALKETKGIVTEKEKKLEAEEKKLAELKTASEKKQAEVQKLADETDEKIDEYLANISLEELAASNLNEQIASQKTLLQHLEEQAAREEEERLERERKEREAAELAARKQAEEEAAQAAEEDADEEESRETSEENDSSDESEDSVDEEEFEEYESLDEETSESDSEENSSEETSEESESSESSESAESSESSSESSSGNQLLGTFKITAYCNCAQCCGRAGAATASGVMPTSGHTVAMGGIDFGTKLMINGTVYTVEDRGTPYGHVDIFMDSHQEALNFGLQYADVYLVG